LRYNYDMELLAPAGNLEKLKTAVRFGANAVYCGIGSFSLRAPETSFTIDELAEGVDFAHQRNCKVYLAMNIFAFDKDLTEMELLAAKALAMNVDAFIVSDPGLLSIIRHLSQTVKIHLSTQANTTNSESVKFWSEQGIDRIVLARELSLAQIKQIRDKNPVTELEVFIHGAMCISYSGRCLLSQALNNRSANRGLCTQPCRWEYRIREVGRSGELSIHEDLRGSYILNSRDLCLIEHIPELAAAGVESLKIEGRMKTAYYVAAVTRVYRAALDSFIGSPVNYRYNPDWLTELEKVSHRPYGTGFYLPELQDETEYTLDASYIRDYDFVGVVNQHNQVKETIGIAARNRFAVGDKLEILDPGNPEIIEIQVKKITDIKNGSLLTEAHNSYTVDLRLEQYLATPINPGSIVRRKTNS
jgi:U32 family peptidase